MIEKQLEKIKILDSSQHYKKAFCEECREYKEYHIEENERTKYINNRVIKFKDKIAFCLDCDNEIFVSELRDENLDAMDSAYKATKE